MASGIGRLSAVVILAWIGSASAHATSLATATCFGAPAQTGAAFAACSQAQTSVGSAPGIEVTGRSEASADLGTGELKSRSVAQAYVTGADNLNAGGGSSAEFRDTITIGGGFSGTVGLRMEFSGSFSMNDPTYQLAFGSQMAALLSMSNPAFAPTSGGFSEVSFFVRQISGTPFPFVVELVPPSFRGSGTTFSSNVDPATGRFPDPADVRIVITTSIAVTPSSPTFTVYARLGTAIGLSGANTNGQLKTSEMDFGHTARLSLVLPAGVPWTSDSGVFLQGVPEPSTGAQLAAGVLCLGVVSRVRRSEREPGTTMRAVARGDAFARLRRLI